MRAPPKESMTYPQSIQISTLARACLEGRPFAWQALVDECAPTVVELIGELDRLTGTDRTSGELEEMAARVFEALRANNHAAMREITPETNGRIFLGIIVRRVLLAHHPAAPTGPHQVPAATSKPVP